MKKAIYRILILMVVAVMVVLSVLRFYGWKYFDLPGKKEILFPTCSLYMIRWISQNEEGS